MNEAERANVNHMAKWDTTSWDNIYNWDGDITIKGDFIKSENGGDEMTDISIMKEVSDSGGRMNLTDVMTIFRQIIGYIARIDKNGAVKVEYVAQDMGVDIVDMRLWLLLMESMNIVALSVHYEYVMLRLPIIDWVGIDIRGVE